MFRIITILILSCIIGIPSSFAEETISPSLQTQRVAKVKTAPAKMPLMKAPSAKEQSALIRKEMQKLGFKVRSVQHKGGNSWDVQINGFAPDQAASAYKGAVSVAAQKIGKSRMPGSPPDDEGGISSRWDMNQLSATRSVSRSATLNVRITEAGLIEIDQESFGHEGFAVSVGGGLCDMFSCRAPMLDMQSLPARNSMGTHR